MRQSSDFQPKPIKRKNQAKINPCLSVQVSPLRDSGASGQDIALSLSPAQRQRPRAERNNMSLDLNKNRVSARSFAIEDNVQQLKSNPRQSADKGLLKKGSIGLPELCDGLPWTFDLDAVQKSRDNKCALCQR